MTLGRVTEAPVRAPRWRQRERPESGSTLIEVLMAVVIMGVAFVVIVGGMATAIIGAAVQRQEASASLVIRNAAEAVKNPDLTPYQSGATISTYPPLALQPGFTVTIDAVSCMNATGDAWLDPNTTPCTTTNDTGVQLITVTAHPTATVHSGGPQSLQVVKRKP